MTERAFADRTDVVFVAAWLAGPDSPNADGLRWFIRAVWPLVIAEIPWARLRVTGDAPSSVRALASEPDVEFTGLVPDIYDVYDRARVAVVPLRYGAGVMTKAIEALRFGVPMVTTTVGASGLDRMAPGSYCTEDIREPLLPPS